MGRDEFELVKSFLEWEKIKYYVEYDSGTIARKSSGKQNPKIPGIWIAHNLSLTWCEGFYWCVKFVKDNVLNRV